MALPAWLRPLVLASLTTLACGCAAAPSPSSSPSAPPPPETVIRWAIGSQQLAPSPPTADRLLLALPANKPIETGTRVTPSCLKTTSFLPAPKGDPRIFFLIGGQLHVRKTPGQDPTSLAGNDPALNVTRLLAADNAASPLQIVVTAKPRGVITEEIWLLTVDDQSIHAITPITGHRAFADKTAFFAQYNVPRCLPGGRRCLVVTSDSEGSHLDVEPTRGEPPEPFTKLPAATVLDAAWASADGQSLYLLMPCS